MRNLLNPKWIFIINTLPVAVLIFICYGQFHIIKTLLDDQSKELWYSFGTGLAALGLLNAGYALYLSSKRLNVTLWYSFTALAVHSLFIYLYIACANDILPSSVPQWMVPANIAFYPATFLMPTILYALFILVVHFTPERKNHSAFINLLIAAGFPVGMFLLVQVVTQLFQGVGNGFSNHVLMMLFIAITVFFLFFIIRSVFILAGKKAASWKEYQLFWKVPISIVLPFFGLVLNNGLFGGSMGESGVFGNFLSPWFYALAFANGFLICAPDLNNKIYRLILFIGRCITFSYTLYFFLVFLPFLPLSVLAIIAIGTGFLMLTPLLLFVIHSNELSSDFRFLRSYYTPKFLTAIALAAFVVIPACITVSYLNDRQVLHQTLDYIYTPDYSKEYNIDKTSLQKTLGVVKHHLDDDGDFFNTQTPYLSSYFNWLVLDNLTLSGTRINTIERVFFDKAPKHSLPENIANRNVHITNVSVNSVYDPSQNAWKSRVDMEITNNSKDNKVELAEFATTIDLPVGCWISDYYLYVGDRKEPGILAEKKTATWVFSQIRNENRDPGILHYLTGNKVAFRIFPFAKNEVRRSGIEFLHKEPLMLTIDDKALVLGDSTQGREDRVETADMIYVPAKQKRSLQPVQRKPYFHFLVDVSNSKSQHTTAFISRIEKIAAQQPAFVENAKVSFVNSYVHTVPFSSWTKDYHSQTFDGGFYLDRAIKTTLYTAHKTKSYPLIIVITDSIQNAILSSDFSDFRFTFPEGDHFYVSDDNGSLKAHSLVKEPLLALPDSTAYSFAHTVLAYPLGNNAFAYLPDNGQPDIILKKDTFKPADTSIKEKNWLAALAMQAQFTSQVLHPHISDEEWVQMVKYSFRSRVMTPVTSYLVVENEAQKAILKKKQEQVLSGNKSLDLGDDAERMTEPGLVVISILLVLGLWYKEKRKKTAGA